MVCYLPYPVPTRGLVGPGLRGMRQNQQDPCKKRAERASSNGASRTARGLQGRTKQCGGQIDATSWTPLRQPDDKTICLAAVYADSCGAGPGSCASYTYSLYARRPTSQRYSLTMVADPAKAQASVIIGAGRGFARRPYHRARFQANRREQPAASLCGKRDMGVSTSSRERRQASSRAP
jgi:hypothetical protein